jgi:hypothetical protein
MDGHSADTTKTRADGRLLILTGARRGEVLNAA